MEDDGYATSARDAVSGGTINATIIPPRLESCDRHSAPGAAYGVNMLALRIDLDDREVSAAVVGVIDGWP